MRQVVLDTETTGLSPEDGHRIIEIGCVELLDRRPTGNRFHVYLNPEREIDQGAIDVHGLDNRFLADKPIFADIAEDFLAYVQGTELIIHNAPFDVGFINFELRLLGHQGQLIDYCAVLDTLALAKKKHPGQRNSLDALCKRYRVDNSNRELHGALLDAEILTEVYLAMTGGQSVLPLEPEQDDIDHRPQEQRANRKLHHVRAPLPVLLCSEAELRAHEERLAAIDNASNGRCLWRQ